MSGRRPESRSLAGRALAVGLLLWSIQGHAQPSYAMLANTCAGCHGTNGYSTAPMPIIAGLSEAYLAKTLRAYRDGRRPSTIMGRIARAYSDAEIDALAAFFAAQVWRTPAQETRPEQVRAGARIHAAQCEACHRRGGRYQDADTPRLAGQWRGYLEIALDEYWRPERKMPSLFMTIVVSRLRSDERGALAEFYASQR